MPTPSARLFPAIPIITRGIRLRGFPISSSVMPGANLQTLPAPPYAVWWITGETRQLGYLRVTVDPANNTATATEIFVASVDERLFLRELQSIPHRLLMIPLHFR